MTIPKIVWQTHEYNYNDLPKIYKYTSSIWKQNSHGWDYRYVTGSERRMFIQEYFPQYLYLYDHIGPGIYKADFWRYLVLYQFGGLYADMDSVLELQLDGPECAKLINFNASAVVAKNLAQGVFSNAFIMSEPKNPVMLQVIESVIDKCKHLYDDTEDLSVTGVWVNATGPVVFDEVIRKNIADVFIAKVPVTHCDAYKHSKDLVPKP
jgi:inositol phosphorylceramide mannosyltransferase catalytic subunit